MLVAIFLLTVVLSVNADFWSERNSFIQDEESAMLGSAIVLTEKELKANRILMNHKRKEYDDGFRNPERFAPGMHFFQARSLIDQSEVYKFLKKVPKGAVLHVHSSALVSSEYLYKQTFRQDLYACVLNGKLKLKFMKNAQQDKVCSWMLLSTLRILNPTYDRWLSSQLSLFTDKPEEKYKHINDVWNGFNNVSSALAGLIRYRPVYEDYFYQSLKELYDDNVMYLEFRGLLPELYELNGTVHNQTYTMTVYQEVLKKFKNDYPSFEGARFIFAPRKHLNTTMHHSLRIVKELKQSFPDFLAGFDLVGQEDVSEPIHAYLSDLREVVAMGLDFYFHAGETNWFNTASDNNLIDAVLLGTKRIGHGFALNKHPFIMKLVKERQIAIEVCPISNQVLMLVSDLRNHPAAALIAGGYPIVISNDDPGIWHGNGLSYDFYMAFMGIAGRDADLRLIKQLALNSLIYSSLPEDQKKRVISNWEKSWNFFIDDVVSKEE